jgi:hypothetical protein
MHHHKRSLDSLIQSVVVQSSMSLMAFRVSLSFILSRVFPLLGNHCDHDLRWVGVKMKRQESEEHLFLFEGSCSFHSIENLCLEKHLLVNSFVLLLHPCFCLTDTCVILSFPSFPQILLSRIYTLLSGDIQTTHEKQEQKHCLLTREWKREGRDCFFRSGDPLFQSLSITFLLKITLVFRDRWGNGYQE